MLLSPVSCGVWVPSMTLSPVLTLNTLRSQETTNFKWVKMHLLKRSSSPPAPLRARRSPHQSALYQIITQRVNLSTSFYPNDQTCCLKIPWDASNPLVFLLAPTMNQRSCHSEVCLLFSPAKVMTSWSHNTLVHETVPKKPQKTNLLGKFYFLLTIIFV